MLTFMLDMLVISDTYIISCTTKVLFLTTAECLHAVTIGVACGLHVTCVNVWGNQCGPFVAQWASLLTTKWVQPTGGEAGM